MGKLKEQEPQKGRQLTITTMGKLTAQDHKKGGNWQSPLWVSLQDKTTKRRHLTIITMGKLTAQDHKKGDN
jgi:hypothetical protein